MKSDHNDLDALRQWATPRQIEFIEGLQKFGSHRALAAALGVSRGTISKSVVLLRKKAAAHGWSPEHHMTKIAPEPFVVKGVSTYYDKEGQPRGQWVKTKLDEQKWLESVKEAVEGFVAEVAPIPAAPPLEGRDTDVIPWINIGDAHIGLLTHQWEVGHNFDLKIAERELCAAIATLIDESADHDRVVINDCGDASHYENFSATTEAGGHALDADGRFPKMIAVYSRIMRFIVDKALSKFNHVDVIVNQGNHSRTNDIWMAELLRVAYGHTGRVNILNNSNVFIGYRMGKTLVVTHHSDKCKPAVLPQVVATDFAADWGETTYRYVWIGHIHHSMKLKEAGGCTVESFNTLAPSDKYAHDGGWRSRQSISIVELSRTYGEVGRRVLSIERVRDLIDAARSTVEAPHYRPPEHRAFSV